MITGGVSNGNMRKMTTVKIGGGKEKDFWLGLRREGRKNEGGK